jgi:hypothetical protein
MSFFRNESVAGTQPSVHHFRVNASQYGSIIPVVYGRARLPGLFIWTGDFVATKSKGPGKGLGGSAGSFYTYSVSVEIALSQGDVTALGRSWHMGSGGLKRHPAGQTNSNWTLFPGAFGQPPWSYMTSKHPGQDLGYSGIAYLGRSAWNLGTSGSPPQITFEVFGLLPYGSGVSDSNPKDIIADILTDSRYGLGLSPDYLADLDDFSSYCVANGFFLSPVFDQQKAMVEWLKLLLDCVHAVAVWSNGQLKIVPYGDTPTIGNGVTWVPSVGPVYQFDDDDFMADENSPPVKVSVTTPSDRANVVNVEYVNAANDYNVETAEAKDEADIQQLGQRRDSPRQFHPITNALMARSIAQLKLQRSLYVANQYEIRVPQRYILAEPMDVVGLSDPYLGLSAYPARIVEISEEADDAGNVKGDSLTITLEDLGGNHTPGYPTQPPGPWGAVDQNTQPNPINTNPIIFEPPSKALGNHPASAQLDGALELWVAASGQDADADWGGCNVYVSSDDATYSLIGRIRNAAAMGTLLTSLPSHSDPDSADTLQVDLFESGGSLTAASHALADAGMNLAYVDGELVCFADVAAGAGPNQFNLGYLRRGRYGSAIGSHPSGSNFAFLGAIHSLDASILRIPLTNAHIGRTLYLKFASINTEVDAEQDLSSCTAYTVSVAGSAHRNRIPHRHVRKYQTSKAYASGAYVKPNVPNGFFYQAQNAGTSGGSEPAWPLGVDESTTDSGGIIWTAIEASPEIHDGSISTSGLDDTLLPDPSGLTYVVTRKGDLKLSWSFPSPRPSNLSHFEIRSGSSWAAGTTVDTTKRTQLLITDPPPGTTTYWVGAINVALVANGAPPSINATMPAVASVSALGASITKKGDVKLSWTPPVPMPAHFSNYEIRTSAAPGNGVVGRTKQHTFLITDPAPGSTTYWVGVLDRSGNYDTSPPSVSASPAAPADVSGLTAAITKKGDVQLKWTKPSPMPAHFNAYEIRSGAGWMAGSFVAHTKQTQFLIVDPAPGSATYWVGVLDLAGNFSASPPSVTASPSAPASVTGLAATVTKKNDVQLKWTKPSPFPAHFNSYEIRAGASWAAGTFVAHTKQVQYLITDPPIGSVTYWVGVLDLAGNYDVSPPSVTGSLSTGFSLGTISGTLDDIGDGTTYGRPILSRLSSGKPLIDFSEAIHLNKNLDHIADGTAYASLPLASLYGTGTSKRAKIDFADAHTSKHLGNIADDTGTKRSAVHSNAIDGSNVPKRAWLKNWSGLVADTADGNRYLPAQRTGPPVTTTSSQNGGLAQDWELSLQAELSGALNAPIEAYVDDAAGHGYLFEIFGNSGGNGCTIYKWDGSGYTLLAAGGPNFGASNRSIVIKRHSTGHFEVYVDGGLYAQVQDTTYGAGGNLYLMYNLAPGYVSKAAIKGGHFDTPAAHKDAGSKRALVDLSHAHVGKAPWEHRGRRCHGPLRGFGDRWESQGAHRLCAGRARGEASRQHPGRKHLRVAGANEHLWRKWEQTSQGRLL